MRDRAPVGAPLFDTYSDSYHSRKDFAVQYASRPSPNCAQRGTDADAVLVQLSLHCALRLWDVVSGTSFFNFHVVSCIELNYLFNSYEAMGLWGDTSVPEAARVACVSVQNLSPAQRVSLFVQLHQPSFLEHGFSFPANSGVLPPAPRFLPPQPTPQIPSPS